MEQTKKTDSELLFFKVFRNQYIRNEISKHISLYSSHWSRSYRESLNQANCKTYVTRFTDFMFRKQICSNNFPELAVVKFSNQFNKEIKSCSFPNSVKEIHFGDSFEKKLNQGSIHDGVKTLSFGSEFKYMHIENVLPNSITSLSFKPRYNTYGELGILPMYLIELQMDNYNTQFTIGQLPDTIKILKINGYNQMLYENVLPLSLEELYCQKFRRQIEKETFRKNINLKKIVFDMYNLPLKQHVLPMGLSHLEFGNNFNQNILMDELPDTIKTLKFGYPFSSYIYKWPVSLTSLSIGHTYKNKELTPPFPSGLLELNILSACFYQDIIDKSLELPHSIVKFELPLIFSKRITMTKEMVPINTIHLTIPPYQTDYTSLPPNIKVLCVVSDFKWSTIKLTPSLQELLFSGYSNFNNEISNEFPIPNTLKRIEFGNNWDNEGLPITKGQLPNSIQVLKFGKNLKQVLTLDILPSSLNLLICYNSCNIKHLKKLKVNFTIILNNSN